ncbi:hypothetical protein LOK49_LG02G00290 [Camellia lanceoleosa]|uniref:Uncharacterized protein n=1 Tax=Camellia lanceoleosa TaxID=1840588 RepID=A0ACC0INQ4_9ERIC|nr:hypothetical protein LOK49_LG02G00290 [Camellia lanceoleosa]
MLVDKHLTAECKATSKAECKTTCSNQFKPPAAANSNHQPNQTTKSQTPNQPQTQCQTTNQLKQQQAKKETNPHHQAAHHQGYANCEMAAVHLLLGWLLLVQPMAPSAKTSADCRPPADHQQTIS